MNVVLLIVDSLRARSLSGPGAPSAPFLDRLGRESVCFRRAYAAECWTLPTHLSMFTGRLPSEHRAHFQTMAYREPAPTVAELLAAAGYHTELVTRNFVFDGTIPGVTRGFRARAQPRAELRGAHPIALLLALAKPGVRRHVRATGFFHPRHADTRAFVRAFATSLLPADELALAHTLAVMQRQRRARRPYFVCCNLYDVHAPYAPQRESLLRPWTSAGAIAENLAFPLYMSKLGQHAYLRDGFRLSAWATRVLRGRYHRAIELIDAKLAAFVAAARDGGLLDDTMLIVTSDHGEAFGEHGLYLHDASVYDVHLRVPLWVVHPDLAAEAVDDVVSTRDLFGAILAAAGLGARGQTILAPAYRRAHPLALAEHFFYPHCRSAAPRYRQNLLGVIVGDEKYVVRRDGVARYDRVRDPDEQCGEPVSLDACVAACRRRGLAGASLDQVATRLRTWPAYTAALARAA